MALRDSFLGMFGLGQTRPKITPFKEQGVAGTQVFGGWIVEREQNSKLVFPERINTYEKILANVAVAGAGIRYFTTLASSANWKISAAEEDASAEYSDKLEDALEKIDQSWSSIISHALLSRFLGFSVQEWTAKRDEKEGYIYFSSIENRPQRTIERFDIDDKGNILGFGQRSPLTWEELYIPRSKCLYMVDDLLTDSPAGMGVIRHIADTADRLNNYHDLEKQGLEKDLRNIPIGRVPYTELNLMVANGEITEEQKDAAIAAMENIVKLARKQNSTGLLLDSKPYISKTDTAMNVSAVPQWDLSLLGSGQQASTSGLPDIAKAIERLQMEVARCFGTEAMLLSGGGSQALSNDKSQNLYLIVNSALNDVKFRANKDIIDTLWKLNGWPDEMKPEYSVEEVNQKDAEAVAAVLRDMATAGATLAPDDPVINDVRELLGVSQADLEAAAMMAEEERRIAEENRQIRNDKTYSDISVNEIKDRQKKDANKK